MDFDPLTDKITIKNTNTGDFVLRMYRIYQKNEKLEIKDMEDDYFKNKYEFKEYFKDYFKETDFKITDIEKIYNLLIVSGFSEEYIDFLLYTNGIEFKKEYFLGDVFFFFNIYSSWS
jgi:hypothetical protein